MSRKIPILQRVDEEFNDWFKSLKCGGVIKSNSHLTKMLVQNKNLIEPLLSNKRLQEEYNKTLKMFWNGFKK